MQKFHKNSTCERTKSKNLSNLANHHHHHHNHVHSCKGTVLYDFSSNGPNEVSVYRGEQLYVLYRIGARWLFCIRQNKQFGYVPYLYVHVENCPAAISTELYLPTLEQYLEDSVRSSCESPKRSDTSLNKENPFNEANEENKMLSFFETPSAPKIDGQCCRCSMRMHLTMKECKKENSPVDIFCETSLSDDHIDQMPDLVNCVRKEVDVLKRLHTDGLQLQTQDVPTPCSMPLLCKHSTQHFPFQRLSTALNSTTKYFETKLDSSSENSETDYSPENDESFIQTLTNFASDSSGFGDESVSSQRTSTASPSLSSHELDLRQNVGQLKGNDHTTVMKKLLTSRCKRHVTFTDEEEVIGTACADVDRTSVLPTYAFQCDCESPSLQMKNISFNLKIVESISQTQLYRTVVNTDPNSNVNRFTLV